VEYTIKNLARISGVSTRTLRYYDQIGLLCPARIAANDYRIYGQKEVDLLQQILFYRELGVSLKEIHQILNDPDFDKARALESHLSALLLRKKQIERLIDNEAAYGREIREKYGDDMVDDCYTKVKGMDEADWQRAQKLSAEINRTLGAAFEQGDPAGKLARKACALHKEWLCMFWKEGMYSKEAHRMLADGYVADARFTAYYDKIAPGCTKFLRDAIYSYCA